MSYLYTAGQLTASVRTRGDYDSGAPGVGDFISDAFVLDAVSEGYKEGYELLAQADPDRLTALSSSTSTSTTGSFPLPADMYRLRGIDVYSGGQWFRVLRDDPSPLNSPWELPRGQTYLGVTGLATRYRLEGQSAFVTPEVPSNTTVRFTYIPNPVTLSGSDQPIDGTSGLHEYAVNFALVQCRDREDKETATFERKLDRAKARIMDMGRDRDAGQGKCLEDPLRSNRLRGRGRYRR